MAFSTLNIRRVMAKSCLRPSAIWGWKASCLSASHQFIVRGHRRLGSKSKIRNRQPLPARWTEHSDSNLPCRTIKGLPHQHRMWALGGRAPYCPYNPDQQTCADESGNQLTQPSAQVDAEEAKNGTRNCCPDDSEHDVHHKSHIALHKLFCQPTRSALHHPQASEKNYETFFCSLEDESRLGGCSLRSW